MFKITFAIFKASGNFPVRNERLMISHGGKIIRSGIILSKSTGILFGPVDLFSSWFIPHSWIVECMEFFGIAENVREVLQYSMKQWELTLTSNGEELGSVQIKRGIF